MSLNSPMLLLLDITLQPEHQSQVSNKQTRREIVGNNMLG